MKSVTGIFPGFEKCLPMTASAFIKIRENQILVF